MSTHKRTQSAAKLTNWHAIVERDKLAKEISERDGIALVEAYGKVFDEENLR